MDDLPNVSDWEERIATDVVGVEIVVACLTKSSRSEPLAVILRNLVEDVINAVNHYHIERETPDEATGGRPE